MSFSFALIASLFLLAPGFCAWAGLRVGSTTDVARPRPEKPNSTTTLFVIVMGALLGHLGGAILLTLMEVWCRFLPHVPVAYDPNAYRALLTGSSAEAGRLPAEAISVWLMQLALVSVATGFLLERTARRDALAGRYDALSFGWLQPAVEEVRKGDALVVAYVVTKIERDGANVGYEGIVEQVGIDEDQAVTMISLSSVDRFVLRIGEDGAARDDQHRASITLLHLRADELANVAFDVFRLPPEMKGDLEDATLLLPPPPTRSLDDPRPTEQP